MKKSKLDNPAIKDGVVKQLAVGIPQEVIAKQVGLDRSQVSRFKNRSDIRPFIEQEQVKLIEVVPDAVENVKTLVKGMKDIPEDKNKSRELAYKATSDVLKSTGLYVTPIHSQTLINICSDQFNAVLSPEVLKLLSKKDLDEVIDIDLELE